jgi:hypothetical protein
MNIFAMTCKVFLIADTMVGESALPDFSFPSDLCADRVRLSAFDELDSAFDCKVVGRSQQQMNLLRHDHKRM